MDKVYLVKALYGGGRMAFEEPGDALEAASALVNEAHPEDAVEAVPIVRGGGGAPGAIAAALLADALFGEVDDDGCGPVRDDD